MTPDTHVPTERGSAPATAARRVLALTPLGHAAVNGYTHWTYLRLRARGITVRNAAVLAAAGYDITPVTL